MSYTIYSVKTFSHFAISSRHGARSVAPEGSCSRAAHSTILAPCGRDRPVEQSAARRERAIRRVGARRAAMPAENPATREARLAARREASAAWDPATKEARLAARHRRPPF